jgi:acyl-[acyl carrier protein]--UDP-N-acetylglucosamine O-acyltransferase
MSTAARLLTHSRCSIKRAELSRNSHGGTIMNRSALAGLALALSIATTAFAQSGPAAGAPSGAIPVFVFAGQSNAVGVDTLDELTADQRAAQPKVLFYGPNETGNTWGALTPSDESPNLVDGRGRRVGSFGPEISAGQTISDALGGPVVAEVKLAVGGTGLYNRWNPASGDLYAAMVTRVNRSLADLQTQLGQTGYIAGFFWMQGESDAQSDEFRDDYAVNLKNFIAAVRRDFNSPNLPFVFGQIINFDPNNSTSTVVRAQQQAVADDATVTDTAFILTDDLGHQDFIHFNGQAIYTLGLRFSAGYLSIVDPDHDGVAREIDNCPTRANADQSDTNGDGFGDACVSPTVFIPSTAQIGANPIIGSGTVINGGVSIGANAEIGANVILSKLVRAGANLSIGDGTKIDQGAQLGDNVSIGSNVIIDKNVVIGSDVVIGDFTIIGAGSQVGSNARIGSNVRLGASVVVAAGAVVPDGARVGARQSVP